jgi:hypothetical protein
MKNFNWLFSFVLLIFIGCKTEDPQNTKIQNIAINKITFDSVQIHILDGDTVRLGVKYYPSTLPKPTFKWSSLSPEIATVVNGKVLGVSAGKAKIIVSLKTDSLIKDTCTIIVNWRVGTTENPILIYTVSDLKKVRDNINNQNSKYGNSYYELMNDLDFSNEQDWIPIGLYGGNSERDFAFNGTFDGNGKIIKNIKITDSSSQSTFSAGLFGYIGDGIVKNLGVEWTSFDTNYTCVGGIVGTLYEGKIINCFSAGKISSRNSLYSYAGGITGVIGWSATIINCYSTVNISSLEYSGGIIGNGDNSSCINCYSNGTINSTNDSRAFSGGITGYLSSGTMTNCIALNDSVIVNCNDSYNYIGRITSYTTTTNENYAIPTMYVEENGIQIMNFTNIMKNGNSLTNEPVILLNGYILNNPIYNSIPLKKWVVNAGVNNGYPVFE